MWRLPMPRVFDTGSSVRASDAGRRFSARETPETNVHAVAADARPNPPNIGRERNRSGRRIGALARRYRRVRIPHRRRDDESAFQHEIGLDPEERRTPQDEIRELPDFDRPD